MQLIEDRSFYVYLHTRLDTGVVFYVGKGKNRRAWNASPFHRNEHWQRIVAKAGGFLVSFQGEHLTEKESFDLEIKTISYFRSNGVYLCNQTNGGDGIAGWIRTDECKRKIGNAHRGKTISDDVRKKIAESVKACGYVPSEEARKKMSDAHLGKKRALGYKHTEEWKNEASKRLIGNKSRTGQIRSAKEKELVSIALRDRPQPRHVCPHCGRVGGNAMLRWHFDNCKARVA
jgi:hypothetical protein